MAAPVYFVVDCDGGVDDFLAIALAAGNHRVSLRAVVAGGGNVEPPKAARNAAIALQAIEREHLATVVLGASRPLRYPSFPALGFTYHTSEGLPLSRDALSRTSAGHSPIPWKRFCDSIEREKEITFAVTGPLTNLANLHDACVGLEKQIAQVVVMGGAFNVPGSVPVVVNGERLALADFNIFSDPHAARLVFHWLGEKVVLVPRDICQHFSVSARFIETRFRRTTVLHRVMRNWVNFRRRSGKSTTFCFNDPLAVAIALYPDLATLRTTRVHVHVEDDERRGQTTVSEHGYTINVVDSIHTERAWQIMLRQLDLM